MPSGGMALVRIVVRGVLGLGEVWAVLGIDRPVYAILRARRPGECRCFPSDLPAIADFETSTLIRLYTYVTVFT